jgi:hypothetical protein
LLVVVDRHRRAGPERSAVSIRAQYFYQLTMADIDVHAKPTRDGWRFSVTIRDESSRTEHEVTLGRQAYQQLTRGTIPPDMLVREAFAFLLEREANESILRHFDLVVIGEYFPEFEAELRRRLA